MDVDYSSPETALATFEPEIQSIARRVAPAGIDYKSLDWEDYANRLRLTAWRACEKQRCARYIRRALWNEARSLYRLSGKRRQYEAAVFPPMPETVDPTARYEAADLLSRLAALPDGASLLRLGATGDIRAVFPTCTATPRTTLWSRVRAMRSCALKALR